MIRQPSYITTRWQSPYLRVDRFAFECHLMVFVLGCYITGKNTSRGCSTLHDPVNPREGKLDVFRHLATNTGHKTCAAASSSTELISPPIRAAFVDWNKRLISLSTCKPQPCKCTPADATAMCVQILCFHQNGGSNKPLRCVALLCRRT